MSDLVEICLQNERIEEALDKAKADTKERSGILSKYASLHTSVYETKEALDKAKADTKEWSSKYASLQTSVLEAHRTIDELNDKQISTTLSLEQEKERADELANLVQKYKYDMEATQAKHDLLKNSQKILSNRYLRKLLDELKFLPRASRNFFLPRAVRGAPGPFRPTEQEIMQIACVCDEAGNIEGANRPRTFLVCYMLGRLDYMDGFGSPDIDLPYTMQQLQLSEHLSPADQERFLEYQGNVLTEAFYRFKKLQTSGNEHQIIAGDASIQFQIRRFLGQGAFGTVHETFAYLSLTTFALKRMPRASFTRVDGTRLGSFENELSNLKRLSHRHLVKLIGSYTDDDQVGILMMPVADINLKEYLALVPADSRRDLHCDRLRSFFGCIAIAIEYLHREKIRHKDIKPGNILVKGEQVYITDFGTSYDWTKAQSDSTDGTNHTDWTPRYASPEVVFSRPRDKSSDIWSLGCVYIEMLTVLAGCAVAEMRKSSCHFDFHHQKARTLWLDMLSQKLPRDQQVLAMVRTMCSEETSERPAAKQIVMTIGLLESKSQYFCRECCKELAVRVTQPPY